MYNDPRMVQRCTLLSIKTGGCPETCTYCSQSSSWRKETGLKAEKLMDLEDVYQVHSMPCAPSLVVLLPSRAEDDPTGHHMHAPHAHLCDMQVLITLVLNCMLLLEWWRGLCRRRSGRRRAGARASAWARRGGGPPRSAGASGRACSTWSRASAASAWRQRPHQTVHRAVLVGGCHRWRATRVVLLKASYGQIAVTVQGWCDSERSLLTGRAWGGARCARRWAC